MVDNNLLSELAESINKIIPKQEVSNENPTFSESGVFLFFSFDLANSTVFKSEHPELWANVFSNFYSHVLEKLGVENYKTPDSEYDDSECVRKLWKLIGDEVLIYIQIRKIKQLYTQITSINKAIENMMQEIAKKVEKENKNDKQVINQYGTKEIIESMLGIKVTAWIAECYNKKNSNVSNIIYYPTTYETSGNRIDFLGKDIDEGFRIAKYAVKNKIIVSPLLAWLIWKEAQDNEDQKKVVDANFKITAFIQMKGVWRGRKVPVIMFHQEFSKFVDILEYDELDIDTYSNIKEVGFDKFINDKRFRVERVNVIFQNIHKLKESNELFDKLSSPSDIEIMTDNIKNMQEFHIACMIFTKNGRILIHIDNDRGFEFGCIKKVFGVGYNNWKILCEEGYKDKYGIKIKADENPVPVATYYYEKSNALGIIIMAEYDGDENSIGEKNDWKFYEIEKILENKGEAVSNFYVNIQKAVNIRKSMENSDEKRNDIR
jgi:hypothetical protein